MQLYSRYLICSKGSSILSKHCTIFFCFDFCNHNFLLQSTSDCKFYERCTVACLRFLADFYYYLNLFRCLFVEWLAFPLAFNKSRCIQLLKNDPGHKKKIFTRHSHMPNLGVEIESVIEWIVIQNIHEMIRTDGTTQSVLNTVFIVNANTVLCSVLTSYMGTSNVKWMAMHANSWLTDFFYIFSVSRSL